MNKERKKLLLILNPSSGQKRANRYIVDIVSLFNQAGFDCMFHVTQYAGDANEYVTENASLYDIIVCIGGDGTLNEVITGIMNSGNDIPIGYIPSGSTNDFANSIGLSKNVVQAARNIINGSPHSYDIGCFNGRYFSYIASFGAFTKTSYDTPQTLKNSLGHLAYLMESIKELPLKPVHAKVTVKGDVYEDNYIFAAVSNSTSVAGILTLDSNIVDMNDGLLEVMLIKNPENPAEFSQIAWALTMQQYECDCIKFISTDSVTVETSPDVNWTLDGEFSEGNEIVEIKNIHNAIRIIK